MADKTKLVGAVVRGHTPGLDAFVDGTGILLRSAARVTGRRMQHGPRRPGWSYVLEVATELFGAKGAALARAPVSAEVLSEVRRVFHTVELLNAFANVRACCRPGELASVPGTWITPRNVEVERTLFYVHGGGYFFGSSKTHAAFLAELAVAARAEVFAVDYCLAPESRFPRALEEVEAAYRALLASGRDPSRTIIAGDSAGGGMSVATMLRLRDAGAPLPAGAMLLSPWVDLSVTATPEEDFVDWLPPAFIQIAVDAYLGSADPRHPHVSPLHADLAGLPPMLVLAGGAELLRGQIESFAGAVAQVGGAVTLEVEPHMIHVWHGFAPLAPEGARGVQRLARFMTATCAR